MRQVLFTVVVAVALLCHFVSSQTLPSSPPVRSKASLLSPVISNHRNETPKTGRAISSTQGFQNKIGNRANVRNDSDEGDDDNDSVFDNSPADHDSSEITFPSDEVTPPPNNTRTATVKMTPSRWKKIPLHALVRFGNENDISTFLKKYVGNAEVVRDNETSEEFLADRNGKPIYNSVNEKVVVTPGRKMVTITTKEVAPSVRVGVPQSPTTRSGVIANEAFLSKTFRTNDDARLQPKPQSFTLPVCNPENKTVAVPITFEPHLLVIPRCVRVERCGGCCLSDVMVCEPETKDTVDFHIKKLAYVGEDGPDRRPLEFVDDEVVKIERHTSCKCKCRTKPEDCSPIHRYAEDDCSCVCRDQREYDKCQQEPSKIWDKDTCMCTCREIRDCSSGLYYDLNTCACEQEVVESRRYRKRQKKST